MGAAAGQMAHRREAWLKHEASHGARRVRQEVRTDDLARQEKRHLPGRAGEENAITVTVRQTVTIRFVLDTGIRCRWDHQPVACPLGARCRWAERAWQSDPPRATWGADGPGTRTRSRQWITT